MMRWLASPLLLALCATSAWAAEEKRILFLAGKDSHGWGAHQHFGGTVILSKGMREAGVPVQVEVIREWPSDELLKKQDALVIYADGWGAHPANGHLASLKAFMDRGGGLTVIHWATGLGSPDAGNKNKNHHADPIRRQWRNLVGADFEPWHSVSRFWDASFEKLPKHPVTHGVPPFVIHDECYFHLRCDNPNCNHVTPLHKALPPVGIIHPGRAMDSGSKSAVDAVKRGEEQYCAWGFERPEGGRTFGFTGGHTHWNWGRDELRTLILNGIYWCAGGEVPKSGIHSQRPRAAEMLAHLQGNPGWTEEALQVALDRAGTGELIKWQQYAGGPLPFGQAKPKPGGGGPGTVLEGENLTLLPSPGQAESQGMGIFGQGTWSGDSQLWWTNAKPNDVLTLSFDVAKAGEYEVHMAGTKAIDYGVHTFAINDAALDAQLDFFQPAGVSHTGDLKLGTAQLKTKGNQIAIKVAGAHPQAVKGFMFGLDYLRLIPVVKRQALFDGKSLKGWSGNEKYWSVVDGSIVGTIPKSATLGHNEFLWWDGIVHDFELRLKGKISGHPTANSGVQIRSQRRADGHAAGYQADFDDGKEWFGRIYDEHGRALLAERGTKVVIDEAGQRTATPFRKAEDYRKLIKAGAWNDYVIRAVGPRIQTWINGELASELFDHQLGQHDYSGLISIQLHSGPGPVHLEFKDIELLDLGKTDPPTSGPKLAREGISPEGKNLGFEEGTYRGWNLEGEVWKGGPIKGDTVTPRRPGQASMHDGDFWVGGYERKHSDEDQGILTSDPFEVTHPWGSFLIGAGPGEATRVELVGEDDKVFFKAHGKQLENLSVVPVDLRAQRGKKIRIRVVDLSSGSWGHLNYDDFRFHETQPGTRRTATSVQKREGHPLLNHLVPNPGEHKSQTVAGMMVPEGFQVDLIAQEPELTQPVAFTFDERGRIWVVEAHSYPQRQPEGQGKDRIVIFEDADGDGGFEKRKVFAQGLNLVSGIEVGFGGVWVGAAPHFLFFPDHNRDDVPDGKPTILLDGWGLQDTHETLNNFTWGPDGWLYGNQGVFCHSLIGKPGTPRNARIDLRAGVWRYHPTQHEFEIFSHGCSNQWGIDFNERGHMFITHCRSAWGGGPTTYVIKNGHYWNQSNSAHAPFVAAGAAGWNPPSQPVFRNFLTSSARYGHGEGGAGTPGSRALYGGHSHVGTMIYLGDNWPAQFRDQLFTHNLHGRQMNRQVNKRYGSGYETVHAGSDHLYVADTRFMGVDLKYGPDGAVYMIDWQDDQHCHNVRVDAWNRSDGGLYRMAWTETYQPRQINLAAAKTSELVALQTHANEWFVRTARRLLQERNDLAALEELNKLLEHGNPVIVLRAMWAIHVLQTDLPSSLLDHPDEHVRAWAVHLGAERKNLAPKKVLFLCQEDPSAMVRLALASNLPNWNTSLRLEAAEALAARHEDRFDPYLPKLIWFGVAPLVPDNLERAVAMASETRHQVLSDSIVWFLARDAKGRDHVVNLLEATSPEDFDRQLALFAQSVPQSQKLTPPQGWLTLSRRRTENNAPHFDRLGGIFGDEQIVNRLLAILSRGDAPVQERKNALTFLAQRGALKDPAQLIALLDDEHLSASVIPLLGRFNEVKVARALMGRLPSLQGQDRLNTLNALSVQPKLAETYLRMVRSTGSKANSGLTSLHLRQMRSLQSEPLNALLDEMWGPLKEQSADIMAALKKYRVLFDSDLARNSSRGKAAYDKVCAVCHVRDGEGGKLGPDLSGSWRNGIDYFLESIVDPNAVIGENFQLNIVTKKDGTTVSGMPGTETDDSLVIQTLTEAITVPKDQIKNRQILKQSMMPPALLDTLSEQEVVDLLQYLTSE